MIYKKTKNVKKLEQIIKNITLSYNTLAMQFISIYENYKVLSGENILLREEINSLKEKNKSLREEIKNNYSEIQETRATNKIVSQLFKNVEKTTKVKKNENILAETIDIKLEL